MAATWGALRVSPLVVPSALAAVLDTDARRFTQGEWVDSRSTDKRFLCTGNVLTCVTVFAWAERARTRPDSSLTAPIAFGAHIDAEAYKRPRFERFLIGLIARTLERLLVRRSRVLLSVSTNWGARASGLGMVYARRCVERAMQSISS